MKKFFFFAAALVASASMSAQYAHVNLADFNADNAVEAEVGKVLATTNGGNVTVAFEDTWKAVNVKTDSYAYFFAGETALNTDTMGIQGQTNGKDADGGNPATTLLPYASGAALGFTATQNGYLTVFHKASSNKQYVVFEEGSPVGYEFAQLAKIGDTPEVISYVMEGEGEYNIVANPIQKVEEIVVKEGFTSKNGESAMRFPVYADAKYLFGATGSKMSLLGVYFSADKEEISVAKADGADKLVLLESELTALENVEAQAAAMKVIENGQVYIIKNGVRYNVLGAIAE